MRGAELFGVVNAVGEDEAAFGVGVQDFDSLAGHGGLNVAGLLRFAAGMFPSRERRRSLLRSVSARRERA